MGFLGNITKRYDKWKKGPVKKHAAEVLYKKRDKTLNAAIAAGKVTRKQLTALKTVRSQKDTKPRKKVPSKPKGLIPTLIERTDKINKMNKGG